MSRNRLDAETSPYLLQHKDNPVHWRPWGPEAFAEARRLDRPVLLSVGYAACHWCHVMAHESFEDEETAALMNDLFINIKVDREERPDVDALYMAALHRIGDRGGWPLTMFLTPDARPFWGGTYFPKTARYGRPAFADILKEVARVFREERHKALNSAASLTAALTPTPRQGTGRKIGITPGTISTLAARVAGLFDPIHGGLNGAPKFPNAAIVGFMWKAGLRLGLASCLKAVETTLINICQGGVYDHLGGGMARYSVDERWLVPHFEKMLYDNALLVGMLTEAWKETARALFKRRVAETVEWMLREMAVSGGGFAASLDADSEGVEGKFYVWSHEEIRRELGEADAAFFGAVYGVTAGGNWEGLNILNRLRRPEDLSEEEEERLTVLRGKLLAARSRRARPGWDDKALTDWNGVAISALVQAGETFQRPNWIEAAERAYGFVKMHMERDGRLRHSFRAGKVGAQAVAADYANMIGAALALHQATGKAERLEEALIWADAMDQRYWSKDLGGYCLNADDSPDVIVRMISAQDDATPNANATMLSNLIALHVITGADRHRERAEALYEGQIPVALETPVVHAGFLGAVMDMMEPIQIVGVGQGDDMDALRRAVSGASLPGAIAQWLHEGVEARPGSPAHGKGALDGKPTVYVCLGPQCLAPVADAGRLTEVLRQARRMTAAPGS
jgi:uncharacterized protein YyaL (SSP411 family)